MINCATPPFAGQLVFPVFSLNNQGTEPRTERRNCRLIKAQKPAT